MRRILISAITIAAFTGVLWALVTYEYTGVTEKPDITQIQLSINNAGFGSTSDGCRWDEDDSKLKIYFDASLMAEEKSTLDTIVTTNSNWSQ